MNIKLAKIELVEIDDAISVRIRDLVEDWDCLCKEEKERVARLKRVRRKIDKILTEGI